METARRIPRTPRTMAAALALALLLAACGQSGPLYLPDEPPRAAPDSAEPAPPDDDKKEDDGAPAT